MNQKKGSATDKKRKHGTRKKSTEYIDEGICLELLYVFHSSSIFYMTSQSDGDEKYTQTSIHCVFLGIRPMKNSLGVRV